MSNMVLLFWVLLGRLFLETGLSLFVSRDVKAGFYLIEAYECSLDHMHDVRIGDFRFLDGVNQSRINASNNTRA